MSQTKKAALIGCGMIAETHLTALLTAGADVIGVYDKNFERASSFAAAHTASLSTMQFPTIFTPISVGDL